MQVTLGRKGDYTVRAVLHLARHYGKGRRKSREIAAEMDIPERYLPQILANLVRHNVLVAVAGPDGGYALARDPGVLSLFEIVEVAGQLRPVGSHRAERLDQRDVVVQPGHPGGFKQQVLQFGHVDPLNGADAGSGNETFRRRRRSGHCGWP